MQDNMQPLISLLHPTVRPKAWKMAADNWFKNCDNPENVEYVLVPEKAGFPDLVKTNYEIPFSHPWTEYNGFAPSTVGGSNYAAKISRGKVLMTLADDFYSAPGWDTNVLRLLEGKLDQQIVIWPDTGIPSFDDHFISLPILTRAYYNELGYIFFPEYTSYYADADFTAGAMRDGVEIIQARDILKFHHIRGGLDQSFPFDSDEAYKKNGGPEGVAGGTLYGKRSLAGFPR